MNYNFVVIAGNLTRHKNMRIFDEGSGVITFSLAYNSAYRNKANEWVNQAHFFEFKYFLKNPKDLFEKLIKGTPVLVEGELRQETWEKDGQKFSRTIIVVKKIKFINKTENKETKEEEYNSQEHEFEEDYPF